MDKLYKWIVALTCWPGLASSDKLTEAIIVKKSVWNQKNAKNKKEKKKKYVKNLRNISSTTWKSLEYYIQHCKLRIWKHGLQKTNTNSKTKVLLLKKVPFLMQGKYMLFNVAYFSAYRSARLLLLLSVQLLLHRRPCRTCVARAFSHRRTYFFPLPHTSCSINLVLAIQL